MPLLVLDTADLFLFIIGSGSHFPPGQKLSLTAFQGPSKVLVVLSTNLTGPFLYRSQVHVNK